MEQEVSICREVCDTPISVFAPSNVLQIPEEEPIYYRAKSVKLPRGGIDYLRAGRVPLQPVPSANINFMTVLHVHALNTAC